MEQVEKTLLHFIVNPHSRGGTTGKKWEKNLEILKKHVKFDFDFTIADGIGTGVTATIDAIKSGANVLVGVGGEGTINEVVNGIYQSNSQVKLGFIRSGTVNDYQQIINLPKDLIEQIDILNTGYSKKTPLTLVKGDVDRVALNIADVGIGANIAYMASIERKLTWIKGSFRYTLLALIAIKGWKNKSVSIQFDDRKIDGDLSMMLSGFSTQTGGYIGLPHANIYGVKMAYFVAMNFSKWQMIRMMGTLKKGKHSEDMKGVYMGHTNKISLQFDEPVIYEVDGEPFSYNSNLIELESLPNAIEVIVPNKI